MLLSGFAWALPESYPAAVAHPFGPTPRPSFATDISGAPNVTVAPAAAEVAAVVNVSGGGFLADAQLNLYLNGTLGDYAVSSCDSNATGNFSCDFSMPAVPAGSYQLNVTDTIDNGSANFTVLPPTLSAFPSEVYIGANLTTEGGGFAPGASVDLTFNGTTVTGCEDGGSLIINSTGGFSCSFPTPAERYGSYPVVATDGVNSNESSVSILRPTLALSPSSGYVGNLVNATGQGYVPGDELSLEFGPRGIASCSQGSLEANYLGDLNCTFSVPGLLTGSYSVQSSDGLNTAPSVMFVIGPPVLHLSASEGTVGSQLVASGSGFANYTAITLTFGVRSITSCSSGGLETGATGGFTCAFSVPPSTNGDHPVNATDSYNLASETYRVEAGLFFIPTNGSYGSSIRAVGTGFAAGVLTTFTWNSTVTLCSATSGPNGSAGCTFAVPNAPAGDHTLTAAGGGDTATATFLVDPLVSISASSGVVGTVVDATVWGFNHSGSISVYWDQTETLTGCVHITPNTNGGGSCSFTIPPAPGGVHTISFEQSSFDLNATFNVTNYFAVNPTSGIIASKTTLTGTGFAASTQYTVCLQATVATCSTGTSFTTQANGTIPSGTTYTIPVKNHGSYLIDVSVGATLVASTPFTIVRATVVADPESGPVGTVITLSGGGFVYPLPYNYCFQTSNVACPDGTPTFNANSTGGISPGSAVLTVPFTPLGKNYVDVSYEGTIVGWDTFQVVENLSASAYVAAVGDSISVVGSGMLPLTSYTVFLNSTTILCTGFTDGNGSLSCTFTVPPFAGGLNLVEAAANTSIAGFDLYIRSTLATSPGFGPVGTTVSAAGSGFPVLTGYVLDWGGSGQVCGGTTNVSGSFACTFAVPGSPAGVHPLTATSASLSNASTFDVVPSFAVAPFEGTVGSSVDLTGAGFDASAVYSALWNGETDVCTGVTADSGSLSCTFTVPSAPAGANSIVVDEGQHSLSAEFTVGPSIGIAPHNGTVGSLAEVTAAGLVAGQSYTLAWNATTVLCSGSASSLGQYDCNFTVPYSSAGVYNLTGTQGSTVLTVPFEITPSFGISAGNGTVGARLEVIGAGFGANSEYTVLWNSTDTLCSGTSNASGGWVCSGIVPVAPGGSHAITVIQGSSQLSAAFRVLPSLTISSTSAAVGSSITVTGFGYLPLSSYSVVWSAGGVLCAGFTSTNGVFVCTFNVPAVGAGSYTITGAQGTTASSIVFSVTGPAPAPPSSTAPFPWWIVAVLVAVVVIGFLGVFFWSRRRPAPRPRTVQPWDESTETPQRAMPPPTPTSPVPLSPIVTPPVEPTITPAASSASPASAHDDVDALIARLNRIADEVYKKKPAPELDQDTGSRGSESGAHSS